MQRDPVAKADGQRGAAGTQHVGDFERIFGLVASTDQDDHAARIDGAQPGSRREGRTALSGQFQAVGHVERVASERSGLIARQKNRGVGHVLRRERSPLRRVRSVRAVQTHRTEDFGVGVPLGRTLAHVERREHAAAACAFDGPRVDRVQAYSSLAQLTGQSFAQRIDHGLGNNVGNAAVVLRTAKHGRNVDDAGARRHVRRDGPGQVPSVADKVCKGIQQRLVLGRLQLVDRKRGLGQRPARARTSSIVDQHVDATQPLQDLSHTGAHLLHLAAVHRHHNDTLRRNTLLLHQSAPAVIQQFLAATRDRNRRTFQEKAAGDCSAHVAATASDQRDLARQTARLSRRHSSAPFQRSAVVERSRQTA